MGAIDRAWRAAGVDFAAVAARDPALAWRRGVLLLALAQTLIWAGLYYSFAALLLSWEDELGWAKTALTPGLTAAVLVAAFVSPLAGRAIDAGHGRAVLSLGALAGAAALASLSLVASPWAFVAVWTAIGAAQGFCLYVPCFSFVTRTLGDGARAAIIRITLIAGFASPIAFPSGALLADALGWRGAVVAFAVVVALVGVPLAHAGASLLQALAAADAPTRRSDDRAALARAMRRGQFWLIALAFPLMGLNHGILLNHLIPLLVERGMAEALAVTAASLIGPMQVAGRLAMMRVDARVGGVTMAAVAFGGVAAAALVLLAAGASPVLAFLFAAMQGAFYGLVSVLQPVVTAEALGRAGFGAISGRLAVPYLAGFALAPHLGALLWAAGGYDLAVAVAAALALLGAAVMLVLRGMRG